MTTYPLPIPDFSALWQQAVAAPAWQWWCFVAALYVAVTGRAAWRYAWRFFDWRVSNHYMPAYRIAYPRGVRPVCAVACAPTTTAFVLLALAAKLFLAAVKLLWRWAIASVRPTYTTAKSEAPRTYADSFGAWFTSPPGMNAHAERAMLGIPQPDEKPVTPRQCGNCKKYKGDASWCRGAHMVYLATGAACQDAYEPKDPPQPATSTDIVSGSAMPDGQCCGKCKRLDLTQLESSPGGKQLFRCVGGSRYYSCSVDAEACPLFIHDGKTHAPTEEQTHTATSTEKPAPADTLDFYPTVSDADPTGEDLQSEEAPPRSCHTCPDNHGAIYHDEAATLNGSISRLRERMNTRHDESAATLQEIKEAVTWIPMAKRELVQIHAKMCYDAKVFEETKAAVDGLGCDGVVTAGKQDRFETKIGGYLRTLLDHTSPSASAIAKAIVEAIDEKEREGQISGVTDVGIHPDSIAATWGCPKTKAEPAPPRKCVDCKHCPPKPDAKRSVQCEAYALWIAWHSDGSSAIAPHHHHCFTPKTTCAACEHCPNEDGTNCYCVERKEGTINLRGSDCQHFTPSATVAEDAKYIRCKWFKKAGLGCSHAANGSLYVRCALVGGEPCNLFEDKTAFPEGQCCGKCENWTACGDGTGNCGLYGNGICCKEDGTKCIRFESADAPLLCTSCLHCPKGLPDDVDDWACYTKCGAGEMLRPRNGVALGCHRYEPRPSTPKTCGSCAKHHMHGGACFARSDKPIDSAIACYKEHTPEPKACESCAVHHTHGGNCIRNLTPENCGFYEEHAP